MKKTLVFGLMAFFLASVRTATASEKELFRCGAGYCYDVETKNLAPVQQEPLDVSIYPQQQQSATPAPVQAQVPAPSADADDGSLINTIGDLLNGVSILPGAPRASDLCTSEEIDRDSEGCAARTDRYRAETIRRGQEKLDWHRRLPRSQQWCGLFGRDVWLGRGCR